jgi:hypothetical protein
LTPALVTSDCASKPENRLGSPKVTFIPPNSTPENVYRTSNYLGRALVGGMAAVDPRISDLNLNNGRIIDAIRGRSAASR